MTQQPIFHVKEGNDQQVWLDNFLLQEITIKEKEKTKIVFDNAALQDVASSPSDSILLINKTSTNKSFSIPTAYETLLNQGGQIELAPFKSAILIKKNNVQSGSSMPWLMLLL